MTAMTNAPVPTCEACHQPHEHLTITLQSGRRCPDCGQPFSATWAVETVRLLGLGAAVAYVRTAS